MSNWFKCYGEGWTGTIVPSAFCHPAKFSRALIRRIYAHAIEEGWVEAGSAIIDPFGGVALGGLEAMRRGLHWVGIELEDRFVQLGQQNIDLWNSRYAEQMPNWGTAIIVQGDSRRLGEVLAGAQLCLSSPPFSTSLGSCAGGGGCLNPANKEKYKNTGMANWKWGQSDYGQTEGNLGNLPDTGFEAALALGSPPYGVLDVGGRGGEGPGSAGAPNARKADGASKEASGIGYGSEPGQLAQMPEGDLIAVISSPPFLAQSGGTNVTAESGPLADVSLLKRHSAGNQAAKGYGSADGQLAALPTGDHAEALKGIPCHFCNGTGIETIDGVDIDGNHSNYEIKCHHCTAALEAGAETGRAQACISSPPFLGSLNDGLRESDREKYTEFARAGRGIGTDYGSEEGQLGQMPPGNHAAALEAEPLYAGCLDNPAQRRDYTGTGGPIDSRVGCEAALEAGAETGQAQVCISSPPFENVVNTKDQKYVKEKRLFGDYGDTTNQLGQQQGLTFWAASREILEEVYEILAPGGHAIWVVKAFVRNKAIVDFPGQWRKLCESVGFRTLHEHHAILTEDRGAQHTLDGGLDVRQVKRASFFRRLHESKYPHLAINHEVVLCMIKET